jgi:type II secretory pathway predicted ATPase ExeA
MELGAAGLLKQPFCTHGRPLVFVPYTAQHHAFKFLSDTYSSYHGLGLFQGPPLAGKTTILRQFTESLGDDAAIAVVDGAGLNTTTLLEAVLSQFGYDLHFNSVSELISMLKVFMMQQTASDHTPLLIVENTHALNPSALRALCELAEQKVKGRSALRLVLASDRSISPIVNSPALASISMRLTGDFNLEPLTVYETAKYLHAKLRSGGCFDPQGVLPADVCDELHTASGGWPGVLDRLMLLAIANADQCPIRKDQIEQPKVPSGAASQIMTGEQSDQDGAGEANGGAEHDIASAQSDAGEHDSAAVSGPPRLFLTYNGRTLREIEIDRARILIGRSDHNDVCVNSRFISRHHAMLVRHGSATILIDLNSTNGTYVNSQRVTNYMLVHDDVISVGNHGVKFHDPNARERLSLEGIGFADTIVMNTLRDLQKLRATQSTQRIPVPAEERMSVSDSDH